MKSSSITIFPFWEYKLSSPFCDQILFKIEDTVTTNTFILFSKAYFIYLFI